VYAIPGGNGEWRLIERRQLRKHLAVCNIFVFSVMRRAHQGGRTSPHAHEIILCKYRNILHELNTLCTKSKVRGSTGLDTYFSSMLFIMV